MNTLKIVLYTLHADRVEENEERIKAVFRQIQDKRPTGVHYTVYQLADGVSFLHILSYEDKSAHEAFINLPAFREFQAQPRDRFEVPPFFSDAEEAGSY
jgi:quinol monooxygenase YgiN